MAISPVRSDERGVQRVVPPSEDAAVRERAPRGPFARNDRFDRSPDPAQVEPAVVQDRQLHSRLKEIAERRDAAGKHTGSLPPASMFVPLPEAWTPSGVNSKG